MVSPKIKKVDGKNKKKNFRQFYRSNRLLLDAFFSPDRNGNTPVGRMIILQFRSLRLETHFSSISLPRANSGKRWPQEKGGSFARFERARGINGGGL